MNNLHVEKFTSISFMMFVPYHLDRSEVLRIRIKIVSDVVSGEITPVRDTAGSQAPGGGEEAGEHRGHRGRDPGERGDQSRDHRHRRLQAQAGGMFCYGFA